MFGIIYEDKNTIIGIPTSYEELPDYYKKNRIFPMMYAHIVDYVEIEFSSGFFTQGENDKSD